jgi:hypothetical protein
MIRGLLVGNDADQVKFSAMALVSKFNSFALVLGINFSTPTIDQAISLIMLFYMNWKTWKLLRTNTHIIIIKPSAEPYC